MIATDLVIDQNEVELEEECLKILALYQPVASDLRFIVAVVKINNELERIGDLAVNIGERAISLAETDPVPVPLGLSMMADRTNTIIEKALDSLVRQDAVTAHRVLAADDEIDALYADLIETLKDVIRAHPEQLDATVLLFSVARALERLADHATNIAEDVLYMVEGEIHRHQRTARSPTTCARDAVAGCAASERDAEPIRRARPPKSGRSQSSAAYWRA